MKGTGWFIGAGFLLLVTLSLPGGRFLGIPSRITPTLFGDAITAQFLMVIPAALAVSAALFYSGAVLLRRLTEPDPSSTPAQRKHSGWVSFAALILSVFILIQVIYSVYWLIVWDSTNDPIGIAWLFFPALTVLVGGIFLIALVPGKARISGFGFLVLIPILFLTGNRAQQVDYRQLTEARAEKINRAIVAYHDREGRYPDNLQQLFPRYGVYLPGPMLIYGQEWCYMGSGDTYRLGVLDREHWSSPIRFGRVYAAWGTAPVNADVCQPAIDTFRAENPDLDKVLRDYGRPTPTIDLGQ